VKRAKPVEVRSMEGLGRFFIVDELLARVQLLRDIEHLSLHAGNALVACADVCVCDLSSVDYALKDTFT
jgi:hypothetical protein